ncbi:phosphopantetheine-binding protein [Streptomyces sp. 6N223]|uniref:phosphopantetheine-binding protein n=1 Tax=Streptomyces sp. 6N223 TaxID=3457412 RepID=UPI003FD0DDD1
MSTITQEKTFETLKSVFAEIMEADVSAVTLADSLRDLGANSIDRADIITETMEQLDVSLPMVRFGEARNIGDIVAIICEGGEAE